MKRTKTERRAMRVAVRIYARKSGPYKQILNECAFAFAVSPSQFKQMMRGTQLYRDSLTFECLREHYAKLVDDPKFFTHLEY